MLEKAQIERSLRPSQSSLKGSLPKAANDACRTERGFLTAHLITGNFTCMAFTFEPAPEPKPQKRLALTFTDARARMVENLRAELARFNREGRNTRHIKRLSPSSFSSSTTERRKQFRPSLHAGLTNPLKPKRNACLPPSSTARRIASFTRPKKSAASALPPHARLKKSAPNFP
jgi:hypothetical protein